MKKFFNENREGPKDSNKKVERSKHVIDAQTARAVFKVLQVLKSTQHQTHSPPLPLHAADKDRLLQYLWISGDGTRVTLCNEQALGKHLVVAGALLNNNNNLLLVFMHKKENSDDDNDNVIKMT